MLSGEPPIRIMVVDDSVVIRRILKDAFAEVADIEVVGYAANGKIALMKLPQIQPDLITLDVEMPEMDGFGFLRELAKLGRRPPVIMFSTLTAQGAVATLDALALGASDYVGKPANVGSVTESIQRIRDELLPKIRALCPRPSSAVRIGSLSLPSPRAPAAPPPVAAPASVRPGVVRLLVIGCSTGGPNALIEVMPQLPENFPVPILIVQHMPKMFTKILAERLDDRCPLEVVEAREGDPLKPGRVYIAPGEHHMLVRGTMAPVVGLNQDAQENYCRPAVDVLFRSVAELYGNGVLAVIMTGMGQDGLRGCEDIRRRGGQIVVQDEATSVVWGMPGAVARKGLADAVLPLNQIASEILRRTARAGVGAAL
jgi:two-component system chemotaxis response regulator CheB